MNSPPVGIRDLDAFLLIEGRALLKEILQQKLQEHIEQQSELKRCPH